MTELFAKGAAALYSINRIAVSQAKAETRPCTTRYEICSGISVPAPPGTP